MNMTTIQRRFSCIGISGFTLIELMVAMALSLFLVGGVILMYISTQAAYTDSNQLSRMQENVRFASDYLVRDIRNAGFRDELTLTVIEEIAIQNKVVEVRNSGAELIVRYAGRGHCEQRFDDYRVVENRYFLDADTGELRCAGGELTNLAAYDPEDDPGFSLDSGGRAIVEGLTGLNFEVIMADGSEETGNVECQEIADPTVGPSDRCLGVRIGLEFRGVRDLEQAGEFEQRFVELESIFRNSAISRIYAPCKRLEEQAGADWSC